MTIPDFMIKLVAFDWNGTLFSDTQAIYEGINEVLKLFNRDPISLATYQKYFDVPLKKMHIALGIPEKEIDEKSAAAIDIFHSFYEPRADHVRTRAYTKYLLEWLKRQNVESIIFSNHIDFQIERQLKRLKIESYFSAVLANSETKSSFHGRMKQEKLKTFINKNLFLPGEVLVIGDSIEEVEIGKTLGTITVAITGGNCSIARLKNAKPDYLIHNLKEVMGIISKSSN